MKKISFECNEFSTDLFIKVLLKLQDSPKSCKIRIGGSEYDFVHGVDEVGNISIEDKPLSVWTPKELQDFEILRESAMPSAVAKPDPAAVGGAALASSFAPSQSTPSNISPDGSSDLDDDEDIDEILNSDEAKAVKDVVTMNVNQGVMFTAFDITKYLRSKGNKVQHRNTKEIVHALFSHGDMSGYDRSLANIPNVSPQPFVYYPVSEDPSTYQS